MVYAAMQEKLRLFYASIEKNLSNIENVFLENHYNCENEFTLSSLYGDLIQTAPSLHPRLFFHRRDVHI